MKKILLLLPGLLFSLSAFGQPGVSAGLVASGFTPAGAFQFRVNGGPLQIEYSTNLTSWAALENGTDKVTDPSSTNSEWRFYRAKTSNGAYASNVIGFIRIPVDAGKVAVVASPFEGTIHLDKPAVIKTVFGSAAPTVQLSLTTNGKQTAYTWDEFGNNFAPAPPPIALGTGFMVRNTGKDRIYVHFGGELPQGALKRPIPQGETLIGALVPKPGPVQNAVGAANLDGAQLMIWDEQKQAYQTTTYEKQAGRWEPALHYKPGRAIYCKYPEASFQTTFSATH